MRATRKALVSWKPKKSKVSIKKECKKIYSGWIWLERGKGGLSEVIKMFILWLNGGFAMTYICQNSLNDMHKIGRFYCKYTMPQSVKFFKNVNVMKENKKGRGAVVE